MNVRVFSEWTVHIARDQYSGVASSYYGCTFKTPPSAGVRVWCDQTLWNPDTPVVIMPDDADVTCSLCRHSREVYQRRAELQSAELADTSDD